VLVLYWQVRLTLIARVSDGLPLAEGLDRDEEPEMRQYDYKNQAKVDYHNNCGLWPTHPINCWAHYVLSQQHSPEVATNSRLLCMPADSAGAT
jgi:hypothetical protein